MLSFCSITSMMCVLERGILLLQVVQWLGKLAAFSNECAVRCQATKTRPQEA